MINLNLIHFLQSRVWFCGRCSRGIFEGIEEVSSVFRNLTVEKRPRKVLRSTTKASLWAIKFVWKFPVVGDVSQNSVEIRVHVSSVAKWVIGLGEH